jgi:hypothetical protein|tara:strand:- start:1419 stop:1745 length:327 start_codon:yes stop_codon:yes gene_type:complete
MRELKYRVYIPEFSKFVYFGLNDFDYSDRYLTNDKYPIQQYTGMKDKNGKEIYEGDLIRGMFDFGPAGFSELMLPVCWHNIDGYQYNNWNLSTIEVVGNAFEQKELLK